MYRIYMFFLLIVLLSCQVSHDKPMFENSIELINIDRTVISGLTDPRINFTLLKDDEDFLTVTDGVLDSSGTGYSFSLNLLSGANYRFSDFTITEGSEIVYILDTDSQVTIDGFSISTDGVFSTTPTVTLKRVYGMEYDALDYSMLSVDVITDESMLIDTPELTFKVSSNVPGATFTIYKYTIYWVTGPILEQNEIFDMDTGEKYDPLEEGDNDPWGSGKYKIETVDSSGNSVFVIGLADEWSMKSIYLNLE